MISTRDNSPFFIVGAGRSGSTLLRLILAGHSRLHIPPETHFIKDLVDELPLRGPLSAPQVARAVAIITCHPRWPDLGVDTRDFRRQASALAEPDLADVIGLVYSYQLKIHGKHRFGDKTPKYIQILPQLNVLYPGAKFIHLVRDGRDVAISYGRLGWGRYYDRDFAWSRAMQRRREYLASPLAERILDVKYEDLVLDPQATVERICRFLGEDYDPQMLDWRRLLHFVPERDRPLHGKLDQPLIRDDVEAWRLKLSVLECFAVEACLRTDLRELGYPLRFSAAAWHPILVVGPLLVRTLAPFAERAILFLQRRNLL
jgi:hypothetical protein